MKIELATYPFPVLRAKCLDVELNEFNDNLTILTNGMFKIMEEYEGIGLAAPQAKFKKRVITIDLKDHENKGAFVATNHNNSEKILNKKLIMINPTIYELSTETEAQKEGCLSLPGISVTVTRPKTILVEFLDEIGGHHTYFAESLLARCIQHEIDHLNGVLIIDHIKNNLMEFNRVATILKKLEREYKKL